MDFLIKHKISITLIFIIIFAGCLVLINQSQKTQVDNIRQNQTVFCVSGLISNNSGGSDFIVYNTVTWHPTVLLKLPEVTSDNYGAISSDGKYIAYTKWDKNFTRRYLEIYSTNEDNTKSFYQDMAVKNEIIDISWLPDNKTLLFIKNDENLSSYQEVRTLNVETGEESILVKGEVWRIRTSENIGTTAKDFYLKGHDSFLKVKYKKPVASYDEDNPINPDIEWNYYLSQNDLNEIFNYYGGTGTFDIDNVLNLMYVRFSAPKSSSDGTKIIYSTNLDRNSAPGEQTPLWMCSAIWLYDITTGETSIAYSQTDGGAIGRVDWVDDDELCFISYYDFQGSRDSVNYFNLSTNDHHILFPYTDENYNNVTLLPVGNRKITFTTSEKNDFYENSKTILFDIDSKTYSELDIKYENNTVLLEKFIFTKMLIKNFKYIMKD